MKIFVLNPGGVVIPAVRKYVVDKFGDNAVMIPCTIPTGNKKLTKKINAMAAKGKIVTHRGALNGKAMKKIRRTGVPFIEVNVNPDSNEKTDQVFYNVRA